HPGAVAAAVVAASDAGPDSEGAAGTGAARGGAESAEARVVAADNRHRRGAPRKSAHRRRLAPARPGPAAGRTKSPTNSPSIPPPWLSWLLSLPIQLLQE